METCTYGLGADIWKPTTERWQGAEYRAYWYNGTPYLISSSPTRRRRAGEKFFLGTEIHGFIFNKGTAWLRIDIITALRGYGLLRKVTAWYKTSHKAQTLRDKKLFCFISD